MFWNICTRVELYMIVVGGGPLAAVVTTIPHRPADLFEYLFGVWRHKDNRLQPKDTFTQGR